MLVQPPECLKKPLHVPHKLLMGPGPSNCSPRVLQALSQPILGHMHTETLEMMNEVKEGIKYIFQTRSTLSLCVSAAGHAGMEAIMCNLLEPGEIVLIAINGLWGQRASDMASRYGAIVKNIELEPGNTFTLEQIEEGLIKYKPVLFFAVQGESSSGCYQPLEGIGHLCHRYNCLFATDVVASLGSVPLQMDEWGIDGIYTGSQKCLGAPPGITPISFSKKAENKILSRKTPVQCLYLDMKVLGDYWDCFGKPRYYHHTISATLLYGLREALAIFCEEGIENSIRRHQYCARRLYAGLSRLGLRPYIEDVEKRLPTVTTITVPDGLNWQDIVTYPMKKYFFEISGGLGPTVGKVLRVGLMGYNATPSNVDKVLEILEESLIYARSKLSKL